MKKFKLEGPISAFEIDLEKLLSLPKNISKSFNLSKFPSVTRDLTFKTNEDIKFIDLERDIESILASKELIFELTPVSIYRPEKTSKTKNISFRLTFSSKKKTLDSNEISAIIEEVTKKLIDNYGVEVI